jgi:DNA-binding beta-propeller fold protein YncE
VLLTRSLAKLQEILGDPQTYEGTVVSVVGGKLVVTDSAGEEHSHIIETTAKVIVGGKSGKLDDLKEGDRVRITTSAANKVTDVATV